MLLRLSLLISIITEMKKNLNDLENADKLVLRIE